MNGLGENQKGSCGLIIECGGKTNAIKANTTGIPLVLYY